MSGCVVIVTHNSAAHIAECLAALRSANGDWNVVVVDNASSDGTPELIRGRFPEVLLLTPGHNAGFATACNLGAQANPSAEYVVLLNPDVVVEPDTLDELRRVAEANRAAAAGARLCDATGEFQRGFAVRAVPSFTFLAADVLLVNQVWPSNPAASRVACRTFDPDVDQEVEQPAGACLLVQRAAFDRLGGLDERFHPLWFEDVDLCLRLHAAGEHVWYASRARATHAGGGGHSLRSVDVERKKAFWYANLLRFVEKHHAPWQALLMRGLVPIGAALRAGGALLTGKASIARAHLRAGLRHASVTESA